MQLTNDRLNLLIVHLPDTRGVTISPWMQGNLKIGPSVFTYSRLAGKYTLLGTCPGSSSECEDICYAKRITGIVADQYKINSRTSEVPEIPAEAKLVRIHVSGDFDTIDYIRNWYVRLKERPNVTAWAYTRSWRVAYLLEELEVLRALPNMQLFASMDRSVLENPPVGWRIAWIDGDPRAGVPVSIEAHDGSLESEVASFALRRPERGGKSLICPEETKAVKNCEECGYCFDGVRNDVTFLKH